MVDFPDWEPYYMGILRSFGYSRRKDEESAALLDALLPHPRLPGEALWELIHGRTVYILGAHERIESDISDIRHRCLSGIIMAADGASSALRGSGLEPHLILSDLDGRPEDLLYWNRRGVPVVIHAHGDNADRIRALAPSFAYSMGTTQSRPFGGLHNHGGFTDGDRCVFLADHFGAGRIVLCGFDYTEVGKYSFTTDPTTKLRKLRWAQRLISEFEVEYY